MALRAVVSGYATLDYVMDAVAADFHQTTVPVNLHATAWPRAGGAPLYAGAQLAALGIVTTPLVAIGSDPAGEAYRRACRAAGLNEDAINRNEANRTPVCVLIHQPDGNYRCYLDSGAFPGELTATQCAALAAADLVCVSAGDSKVTGLILDHLRGDQCLAWIVKADPACFPSALRSRLLARADLLFCNRSERAFIEAAPVRAATVQIETHGADGVTIRVDGAEMLLPVETIAARDATGAGDTLAGHMLAQILRGAKPQDAARLAITATAMFLLER